MQISKINQYFKVSEVRKKAAHKEKVPPAVPKEEPSHFAGIRNFKYDLKDKKYIFI